MYARVAKWEGGEPEALRRSGQETKDRAASGPPEGVPAKGFIMLIDPESGRSLAVTLFETEDDLRQGDRTLNTMNRGADDVGSRTSVETYEVAVDVRV
jgi:hypothetical protein